MMFEYYVIVTDNDSDLIQSSTGFDTLEAAEEFFWKETRILKGLKYTPWIYKAVDTVRYK